MHTQVCKADEVGEVGHGLIGYGITMYQPLCAYSCRVVLSGSALNCSTMGNEGGLPMPRTPAECFATDDAFLTSMALCLQSRCTDLPAWKIEKYWHNTEASIRNSHRRLDEPGVHVVAKPPVPKWTYQQALAQVQGSVTSILAYGEPLNRTSLVADFQYQLQYETMEMFERMETHHEKYGLVLIALGVFVPIASSWLRFLPLPKLLKTKISAAIIDPPLFGNRHQTPYFNMFIMPTRGQAMLITYVVVLNFVLSGVGIRSAQPNAWWWNNQLQEVLTSFANRTGVLSFANVPLLILYAGRNNFLYWLTDWTQSTFMVMHRWTAYLCTLQAIMHSIVWLRIYVVLGWHDSESKLAYWVWGIIATLAMSLLLPASAIPFRAKIYEMFFFWHIVLAVFSVLGCYLHIIYRFDHQWGYEIWMYIAIAVWGFDRVARLVRMARNGWRQAVVTVIDYEYIQVDIEGAKGHGHAYLYFPTLTWRIWESHPFSIVGTRVRSANPSPASARSSTEKSIVSTSKPLATTAADVVIIHETPRVGLSFLIRTFGGATGLLRHQTRLPVLVEADYLPYPDLTEYQTLVCIVGGVAITAVTPALRAYPGHAKVYWSCRSPGLVESVGFGRTDTKILLGKRFKLRNVLEEEVAKAKAETAVVVSGPASMTDEVRCIVSELARKAPIPVTLIDETYYW
ncbi:ferric reductase like transmembrane component [Colletotrichum graminicola]|uniref:Ferric reductase like transmembrane component n=1 Tax=Colletotrichum graminicola (strain M1.001 / M2 / FGSC 10212) TaxID=645133 RepID=E3QS49_COLGM|nr:ferric reductase like transmembrane component [Colletotrichum graminicola M1.001]EFQ33687.1 ferric reductase like transmembrane component [Colletotrichum graminicola M1.001]WDK10735.1 ferric reductase like transmembrane component [Colletotrichum graminicola]